METIKKIWNLKSLKNYINNNVKQLKNNRGNANKDSTEYKRKNLCNHSII